MFERPLVSGEEMGDIAQQLLAKGADIVEINTIRKRLSAVKGGSTADGGFPGIQLPLTDNASQRGNFPP